MEAIMKYLALLQVMLLSQLANGAPPMVERNCTDRCGDIMIPFPFGTGPRRCYQDEWFKVECKNSALVLSRFELEILNISLATKGQIYDVVKVKGPIFRSSSRCSGIDDGGNTGRSIDLTGSPFFFTPLNIFVAVGNTTAFIANSTSDQIVGCRTRSQGNEDWRRVFSNLYSTSTSEYLNACNGTDCCEASVDSVVRVLNLSFQPIDGEKGGCNAAFVADQEWVYGHEMHQQKTLSHVPLYLSWQMEENKFKNMNANTMCMVTTKSLVSSCSCNDGYEGNPYLGCSDIDECKSLEQYGHCKGITKCENIEGSFKCVGNSLLITAITLGGAIGVTAMLCGVWLACKKIKKRRKAELRKKFFKRNGGLLLQQQVNSINGSLQKTRIFKSKELEKATDHFNPNRVLGIGGQGTVYKGMLVDGRIVAVKKSILLDEEKVQEFINEVVILSQINHRNVVKLFGCCLETQVPLLVYEFVPNGSLYQYLHYRNDEVALSWELRLQIATEDAGAIAYLHSAAEIPVYHRDIKSNNILLDSKFRAKVSDFGTSMSIAVDQTHLTTHVQGTFGYLDPEYFQSGQFTEKSDVYSFGVVLVELISGRKPIFISEDDERTSLASYFIIMMEEEKLGEIIDSTITQHGHEEQITEVANLARRCLHTSSRFRPAMKEVATELERIRSSSKRKSYSQESIELNAIPTLMRNNFSNISSQSYEDEPLVSYYATF